MADFVFAQTQHRDQNAITGKQGGVGIDVDFTQLKIVLGLECKQCITHVITQMTTGAVVEG